MSKVRLHAVGAFLILEDLIRDLRSSVSIRLHRFRLNLFDPVFAMEKVDAGEHENTCRDQKKEHPVPVHIGMIFVPFLFFFQTLGLRLFRPLV